MISLIFGFMATISAIIGFQLKEQKQIIFMQFISNLLTALSYFVLDFSRMAGGMACMVGAIQTLSNYFYFRRDKKPPKMMTALFLVLYALSTWLTLRIADTIRFPFDFMPFIGSVVFLVGVSTKNSKHTRLLFFANMLIWITYDCMAIPIAIANLVTHLCILGSVVLGIYRYDIRKG